MTAIPSKADILAWIAENPGLSAKRDIAKAFGIKGSDRIELKRLLKELEAEGALARRRNTYRDPDGLPPVAVLSVLPPDADGDICALPLEWQGDADAMPRVLMMDTARGQALGAGERVLARLTPVSGADHRYEGRLIRRIGTNPRRVLGIFRRGAEGGRILPIE